MRFNVTIDRDDDGVWIVECPAIPGCMSQGATKDEALASVAEAIRAIGDRPATSPSSRQSVHHVLDLAFEQRQVALDNSPDQIDVYAEVLVGEVISECFDLVPWDGGVGADELAMP